MPGLPFPADHVQFPLLALLLAFTLLALLPRQAPLLLPLLLGFYAVLALFFSILTSEETLQILVWHVYFITQQGVSTSQVFYILS